MERAAIKPRSRHCSTEIHEIQLNTTNECAEIPIVAEPLKLEPIVNDKEKNEPVGGNNANDTQKIPDGGYGWVCVACVCLLNANSWGVNSAYSVFLAYYLSHNTFPTASPLVFALVGGLSISQSLLVSPLTVYSNRVFGTRTTLLFGTVVQAVALVCASFSTRMWHLVLTIGLLFGWGIGFVFVGSAGIIPQWFQRKRSLAQGIVSSGVGIGGFVYSLIAGALISRVGLPWTFRILALCSVFFNALGAVLVRDRNAFIKPTQQSFNYRLFGQFEFQMLVLWGFISEFGYVTLYYSLPDYGTTIGLTSKQGSIVNALLSLGLAVGRPLVGHLSDRFGRINVAALCTACCGLLCLVMWIFAKSFAILATFALLAGMVCGTFWATSAPVVAEVVGLQALPDTLATLWMMLAVPTVVAEPVALKLRRSDGNIYLVTQIFAGCTYLAGAFFVWVLRSRQMLKLETEKQILCEDSERPNTALESEESRPVKLRGQALHKPWKNHEIPRWIVALIGPGKI